MGGRAPAAGDFEGELEVRGLRFLGLLTQRPGRNNVRRGPYYAPNPLRGGAPKGADAGTG